MSRAPLIQTSISNNNIRETSMKNIIEKEKKNGTVRFMAVRQGIGRKSVRQFEALDLAEESLGLPLDGSSSAIQLRFFRLILETAARLGELGKARWEEFDLEQRIWVLPAARSKNRCLRRVPLTDLAARTLKALREVCDQSEPLVFPTRRGRFSKPQFDRAIRSLGLGFKNFRELRKHAVALMETRLSCLPKATVSAVVDRRSI